MPIINPASFADIGFDLSHNNPQPIDFGALWAAGRRAVFLKATEGTEFKDPMFETYLRQIVDTGKPWCVGAYHFAHGDDPAGQVDHFLTTVDEVRARVIGAPRMLYMLDLERGNNPPTEITAVAMIAESIAGGVPNPMIYCGYDFFSAPRGDIGSRCSHMMAEYGTHPVSAVPWRRPDAVFGWDWWQYTGDGLGPWARNVPGGSAGMDLSCFNTTKHPEGVSTWWDAELAKITRAPA